MEALLAAISYQPVQRWCLGFPDFIPGLGGACVPLSPHGVGTMMGFLLGAIVMARRAKPRGIPVEEVYNAVTWGALGAILGARGFYVLGHLDSFGSLWDVIAVWEGGLTMFGGFIGGLILGVGYLRRRNYPIPDVLDAAAPGFVIGVIIGRIGDLFIADHLGDATDFFLAYRIPQGADLAPGYGPPVYVPGAVVHNTALYDLIGALLLGLALTVIARRRMPRGALFAVFSVWYGLQRLVIDFTRNREIIDSSFFGLTGSQWAGLLFASVGGFALWRLMSKPMPLGEPAPVVQEPAVPTAVPTPEQVTVIEEQPTLVEPPVEPAPSPAPKFEPEPSPAPKFEPEPSPAPTFEPAPVPEPVFEADQEPSFEGEAQPDLEAHPLPELSVEPEPMGADPSLQEPDPEVAAAGVASWAEERTLWSEPPPEVAGPVPELDDESERPEAPEAEQPQDPEDRSEA